MNGTGGLTAGPYDALVLEHARAPAYQTPLPAVDAAADGHDALCGDHIRIMLALRDGRITGYAFDADACAITLAAASMLGDRLQGRCRDEVARLLRAFDAVLEGRDESSDALGPLAAFAGLAKHPSRRPCARLPLTTALKALDGVPSIDGREP